MMSETAESACRNDACVCNDDCVLRSGKISALPRHRVQVVTLQGV